MKVGGRGGGDVIYFFLSLKKKDSIFFLLLYRTFAKLIAANPQSRFLKLSGLGNVRVIPHRVGDMDRYGTNFHFSPLAVVIQIECKDKREERTVRIPTGGTILDIPVAYYY